VNVILPALAAAEVHGVLVAQRRSEVVHVAVPSYGLTRAGRLRRADRPLCGQRARTWRQWPVDGRRICARCARHPRPGIAAGLPADVLGRLLADTLATCRDRATLTAARLAVCSTSSGQLVDGQPLHRHVALAQRRLSPHASNVSAAAWPAERRRSRRAVARERFAALVDLPGGNT
jgi:hypothetical protein